MPEHCGRKIPLQHGWESVANTIQSHSDEQQEWDISHTWECKSHLRMLTSCATVLTLLWGTGTWREPAAPCSSADGWAVLLTAIPKRIVGVHRPHPTHSARLCTKAPSSRGLCWSGQLSSREQSEEDLSAQRKEESGQILIKISCWKRELQPDKTRHSLLKKYKETWLCQKGLCVGTAWSTTLWQGQGNHHAARYFSCNTKQPSTCHERIIW